MHCIDMNTVAEETACGAKPDLRLGALALV